MAFLKAQWKLIVMGVVAVASIGGGAMAIMSSSDIEEKMKQVDALGQKVGSYQRGGANVSVIEAKKLEIEQKKGEFEKSLNAVLALQKNNAFYEEVDKDGNVTTKPREPIMADALPEPKSPGVALAFRPKYNEEFKKLPEKLRARGGPTMEEKAAEEALLQSMKSSESQDTTASPSGATPPGQPEEPVKTKKKINLPELLRSYGPARAAEKVAQNINMYIDDVAFAKHGMADRSETPTAIDIWQAQMSLWIQQDIAAALARCNEERAAELRRQGLNDRLWVAYMPVKRLVEFCIADQLGGSGSGSNANVKFATSFTGMVNDDKRFVVPMQLHLIVEEASIMNVLGHLTSVGFYTPVAVTYRAVPADPLLDGGFVYGDEPVVELTIDLEGYYFRSVFEPWIPKDLKGALKTPGAKMDDERRGGRG